jgi:ATP-binding cassette, subfamily F, member 3
LLSLQELSKQYGGRNLFTDVSLHIGDRDRVAIVGSNGAGKSTMMKIMTGQVEPDSGRIVGSRFNTVGYLPQERVNHKGMNLYDETLSAFEDLLFLQKRMDEINREIADRSAGSESSNEAELKDLLSELGRIQHHIECRDGYNLDVRIKKVLSGLGFGEKDFGRMTEEFSGGWQMRIELAKLLLREPTVLLLDEPTNHLDINSLLWLESYLKSYEGAVVIISHDRRFLDNLVRRTIEISQGKTTEYGGNYSYYLKEKKAREFLLKAAWGNQQKSIRQTMQFVERFRYKATKARQAQSRLRMLEKMDLIELDSEENQVAFTFPDPERSGRVIIELDHIDKTYGPLEVFRDLSFKIERGDRIAILGVNGTGKSTLARIVAGIEPFENGTRKADSKARISYFSQDLAEVLNPRKTVLETIEEAASAETGGRLRALLGRFLFSGEDVFKPVSVLSGGEKSRLALAGMLLAPSNLLVLDEPTNHLDMRSKDVLQHALIQFTGSFLIVSHDRDFLDPLVNKVLDIRAGRLFMYPGTVSGYLEKYDEEGKTPAEAGPEPIRDERKRKREEAEKRQQRYRKVKPLKERLVQMEKEIAERESRKTEIEMALADKRTYTNDQNALLLNREYRDTTTRLNALYEEWTTLKEKIEAIEKDDV